MAGASSSKSKKNDEKNVDRSRLKTLAIRKNLISAAPPKHFRPLNPSKQVLKHHGRDIIRKSSQRKNRFLFSFSGLLAPIGGGKIGDLKNLGTKNPILYLDFPQGQMKLFGTIVYPENRYLTLQFSRGGKNVICDDYFDNMIVFSDAWWIGRKDENPDEARLEFPKELSEGQHSECDFKGGAGSISVSKPGVFKTEIKDLEARSPQSESDDQFSDVEKDLKHKMDVTPSRRSQRTADKAFKFTEVSSEDDPGGSDVDVSEVEENKLVKEDDASTSNRKIKKTGISSPVIIDISADDAGKKNDSSKSVRNHNSLVQSTISTMFKKVEERSDSSKSVRNRSSLVQSTISTMFSKVEEKHTDC